MVKDEELLIKLLTLSTVVDTANGTVPKMPVQYLAGFLKIAIADLTGTPTTVNALCNDIGISTAGATRIVNYLAGGVYDHTDGLHYVIKVESSSDNRYKTLHLTPAGIAFLKNLVSKLI